MKFKIDENLPGCRHGVGQVAVLEDFGRTELAEEGGFHRPSSLKLG